MQRTHDLRASGEDCPKRTSEKSFECDECGKTFQTPILATISMNGQTQTYYACPRCMTKLQSFKVEPKLKAAEPPLLNTESKKPKTESENAVKCAHFLGYLHKHQKNTPFPDECLTCPKMFECMHH